MYIQYDLGCEVSDETCTEVDLELTYSNRDQWGRTEQVCWMARWYGSGICKVVMIGRRGFLRSKIAWWRKTVQRRFQYTRIQLERGWVD